MEIQQVSSHAIAFLTPPRFLESTGASESRTLSALQGLGSEGEEGGDRLSLRLGRLRRSATRLMEAGDELAIEQTRLTIAQTAQRTLSSLQAVLTEVDRLATAVAEGEVPESQIQDVQNLIELRLARMDELVSHARYSGNEVFTGERVRITTEAPSGEGFEFYYPEVSAEILGLGALDVTSQDSETVAEAVGEAAESLAGMASDVASEITSLEMGVEQRIVELEGRFEGMSASEFLNAPAETNWLAEGTLELKIKTGDLRAALGAVRLDAEMVSSLLS